MKYWQQMQGNRVTVYSLMADVVSDTPLSESDTPLLLRAGYRVFPHQ